MRLEILEEVKKIFKVKNGSLIDLGPIIEQMQRETFKTFVEHRFYKIDTAIVNVMQRKKSLREQQLVTEVMTQLSAKGSRFSSCKISDIIFHKNILQLNLSSMTSILVDNFPKNMSNRTILFLRSL